MLDLFINEVTSMVLGYLSVNDLLQLAQCKRFHQIAIDKLHTDDARQAGEGPAKALFWGANAGIVNTVKNSLAFGGLKNAGVLGEFNGANVAALHIAATLGHDEIVEYLVKQGADIEARASGEWRFNLTIEVAEFTPLAAAIVCAPTISTARLLLKLSASCRNVGSGKPDFKGTYFSTSDNTFDAIHLASMAGVLGIVQDVVDNRSVHIRARDSLGKTPMHWAVAGGRDVAITYLITVNGDGMVADYEGRHALHYLRISSGKELVQIVQRLCHAGHDIDQLDHAGRTPYCLAVQELNSTVMAVLAVEGANPNATVGSINTANEPVAILHQQAIRCGQHLGGSAERRVRSAQIASCLRIILHHASEPFDIAALERMADTCIEENFAQVVEVLYNQVGVFKAEGHRGNVCRVFYNARLANLPRNMFPTETFSFFFLKLAKYDLDEFNRILNSFEMLANANLQTLRNVLNYSPVNV